MRNLVLVVLAAGGACGPSSRDGVPDAPGLEPDAPGAPDAHVCPPPPNPAGPEVALAPPFDTLYKVYDLGAVPGVPNPLGGTAILAQDPSTLLVAGGSESAGGAIYRIGVERDACGHIIGFAGTATVHASAPYVDANLVYVSPDLLVYTGWPVHLLSQLAGGAAAPSRETDLRPFGTDADGDSGAGGIGRVPPGLGAAGELRLVSWPGGRWYRVATAPDGDLLEVTGLTQTATVPNQPGGFAYVPAGSPGFTQQSLIFAEWRSDASLDRVAVYDVDGDGDPVTTTRREFFARFPRPWGAYFEPVTGDYLFLSWGTGMDRVYVVQGFVPPPPIL